MEAQEKTEFRAVVTLSILLKMLAWIAMVVALISAFVVAHDDSSAGSTGAATFKDVVLMLGMGAFAGASFAFFAYVLELLRAILAKGAPGSGS